MLALLKMVMKHIMTGIDGETYDIARISGGFGVVVHCALSAVHLYLHSVFDPLAFGTGLAAIVAATGAAVKFKLDGEPR